MCVAQHVHGHARLGAALEAHAHALAARAHRRRAQPGAGRALTAGTALGEAAAQPDVARGPAHHDRVTAGCHAPVVGGGAPVRQVARAQPEGHRAAPARVQPHALEALERERRLVHAAAGARQPQIQLRDLAAVAAARVGHARGHRGARAPARGGGDLQVAVGERGVRQAVAERERRLDALGVVPAVSHQHALLVAHHLAHAGIGLEVARGRQVGLALRERDRQPPAGVVAEQHAPDGGAALQARIPGLQQRRHLRPPRGQHRAAGLQHHHRALVGAGHALDQRVAVEAVTGAAVQAQARLVGALAVGVGHHHHGRVGGARDARGARAVGPVVVVHGHAPARGGTDAL